MATARMRSKVNSVPAFTPTKALQDAALTDRLARTALLAEFFQLSLQRLQFLNAERDMPDVPIKQVVNAGTVFIWSVAKIEQRPPVPI